MAAATARSRMQRPVHVVGVGLIAFTKPGASEPYTVMGAKAARLALDDAAVDYADVQQAYVGYVYGDSTAGQAAIYGVGLTGIPVVNVNNNCSTGSTALFLARQAVESGLVECAIALGFEQMLPGALKGLAVFRQTLTLDEVMASAPMFDPLTRFQCCPPTCGAAAAIVCSAEFAKAHGLDQRVVIAAQAMTTDRPNTYGGRVVTKPSGGLLSKGHRLGATGLAQCYELTKQLRGQAGQRQVEGARLALQHNLGLGGACVVTLYQAVDGGTGRQAASAASATAQRDAA